MFKLKKVAPETNYCYIKIQLKFIITAHFRWVRKKQIAIFGKIAKI